MRVRAGRCGAPPARSGSVRSVLRRERGSPADSRRRVRRARGSRTVSGSPRSASTAGGGPGSQASCECEWGSEAPASCPSFTIGKTVPPTSRARRCHASAIRSSVASSSSPSERVVVGPVDDDFLPLERGVEVGNDADVPSGRAVTEPERLRRGAVFVACAEGTALELVLDDFRCARPRRARGGDCYPAPGERVTTKIRHRAAATSWAGTTR